MSGSLMMDLLDLHFPIAGKSYYWPPRCHVGVDPVTDTFVLS